MRRRIYTGITRTCRTCERVLPLEVFVPAHPARCKFCKAARDLERYIRSRGPGYVPIDPAQRRATKAASRRDWEDRNRGKRNEQARERYAGSAAVRKQSAERSRRWKEDHPEHWRERKRIQSRRRRERIKAAGGRVTKAQWVAILERHGHRCAGCGRGGVTLERDHIVPIAKGGTDSPDNIRPLCGPCNQAKGAN